ncbi:MAG: DUF1538 domain-containing protein [Clostridiales Family XIII bacterium]|nr:DUF1538 domain-containing protein [Clostridiales Family XIII bacterium]
MDNIITEKLKESIKSLLPIVVIVLILNFTMAPMPFAVRGMFLIGALLLMIGMAVFTLGADLAMMPIGEHLGMYLSKSRKIWFIVIASLLMGTMVTIAEPDLQILARQVPSVPTNVLTIVVATGLGLFLAIAMLRIIFNISMAKLLSVLYIGALALGFFIPKEYLAVSFDAGGVTTGPFAIPFILALGVGVSAVRGGASSKDDSFGLAALCSIGPIYAVMILSFLFPAEQSDMGSAPIEEASNVGELFMRFLHAFPEFMHEIGLAVLPLIALFLLFQIFALHLPRQALVKILIGLVYTYFGLVIFLTGVSVGFLPAGTYIGQFMGELNYNWILIPLGIVMGYFIVLAEPAVHVLVEEVETMTSGAITKKLMLRAFSVSVGLAVGLAMLRVITGISIWWLLIPGYGLAIILSRFVPKIFTALAFDSGAVASGPMTATFILPFTMGACEAAGGNVMLDAFGVVAMVAMTPLFTVQTIGFYYEMKSKRAKRQEAEELHDLTDEIETEEFIDWAAQPETADVSDDFESETDMEFVASTEWAEQLRNDEVEARVIEDNDYIDFENDEYDTDLLYDPFEEYRNYVSEEHDDD